jgi:hypothetical protein
MNTNQARSATNTATDDGSLAIDVPRKVLITACAIPVMVIGQFSFLAMIPVAIVVRTVTRRFSTGPLRSWSLALGAAFTAPLAIWAVRPNRAQSLSKDMSPSFAALIVATAGGVIVAAHRHQRQFVAGRQHGGRPVDRETGHQVTADCPRCAD